MPLRLSGQRHGRGPAQVHMCMRVFFLPLRARTKRGTCDQTADGQVGHAWHMLHHSRFRLAWLCCTLCVLFQHTKPLECHWGQNKSDIVHIPSCLRTTPTTKGGRKGRVCVYTMMARVCPFTCCTTSLLSPAQHTLRSPNAPRTTGDHTRVGCWSVERGRCFGVRALWWLLRAWRWQRVPVVVS